MQAALIYMPASTYYQERERAVPTDSLRHVFVAITILVRLC